MEIRKFKPGDRVVRKSDQLMMEVVKYVVEHDILAGDRLSEQDVECIWYCSSLPAKIRDNNTAIISEAVLERV